MIVAFHFVMKTGFVLQYVQFTDVKKRIDTNKDV